ncbi:hypothetical protein L873DRAFT_752134 [Choiromyces venosus 120613-1]|uniref:Uncharacterized protein n=1 Tax=Choiromyces venosus 120613-1 TaxID=1336337 RepID=A0A3N4IT04_9PEZI|nr:hypothetical protein L873DRAFT_752134 [Choiromyces venosus 120613-1]
MDDSGTDGNPGEILFFKVGQTGNSPIIPPNLTTSVTEGIFCYLSTNPKCKQDGVRHKSFGRATGNQDVCRGCCAIAPFGDFNGGNVCLPSLDISIPLEVGSVGFLRSYIIPHYIGYWVGNRFMYYGL